MTIIPKSMAGSLIGAALSCTLAPSALAQLQIPWWTVDCGGGTSSGGGLTLIGTVAQPDAGALSGGALILAAGFWAAGGPVACYANCDGSTVPPVLNVADFACFLNRFAAGDSYANCDWST